MKTLSLKRAICLVSTLAVGVILAEGNLVPNGTFDSLGADGVPTGWRKPRGPFRYEKGAGRNFTTALRFDVNDPKTYDFPSMPIKIEGGKRYRVSGWIRTEGVKGIGARFGLEFSDAKGKYLSPGHYTAAVSGTTDGWKFIEALVDVPTNAATAGLPAFMERGSTGRAWFDDLCVVSAERPLMGAFETTAYRATAAEGDVSFVATIRADAKEIAAKGVKVVFRLPNGKCHWNAHTVPVVDGVAKLTVPVASLPMGKHPVQVMVTANDQKKGAEFAQILFDRVKTLPKKGSRIDAQGRLIVDGKPFFPFGMYMSNDVDKPGMYDQYAAGPFNCAMNYTVANPKMFDEYHKRGIKVIGCIKDAFSGWLWPPAIVKCAEDDVAYVADKVAAVKDHPALIAWYSNDEMGVDWVGRLKDRRALLHELDPDHPVWTVQYQIKDYREYVGTYDIAGTDPYPISRKPEGDDIAMPAKWTRLTRQGALNTRAMWQVPQYFDTGAYGKPKHPTSAPTEEEASCMIWQCIAEGANGIIIYAWHSLLRMDKKEPFAKKWAEICRVGKGVREKFDLLLSDDATAEVTTVKATPDISVRAWRKDGVLWALAVNASYKPGSVTLSAGGKSVVLKLKPLAHAFTNFSD